MTETDWRNDGALLNAYNSLLTNNATGLGDPLRDKHTATAVNLFFVPLAREELYSLYRQSKICQKVVDLLPAAGIGENWLEIAIGKGRKSVPTKAVQYADDLKFRNAIHEAAFLGRLDGDGFVVLGIDDGRDPWEPVNEQGIRQISWVVPLNRYQLIPDLNSGRAGHPEFYNFYLQQREALGKERLTNGKLHHSRVLRLPGKRLYGDLITRNSGYNDSVLQAFYQSFMRYMTGIEYSTRMIADYNVFIYKLKGLASLILQGKETQLLKRFRAILLSMSSLGGLAIDNENEDATFATRNFSGLDAIIDRLKDETSAAAGMPPTKLWGSSQKTALSNSSEGDKYEWADCVSDWQGEILAEPVRDFFRLVFLAKNGPNGGRLPDSWQVKYASALRLTDKEKVELRKTQTEGVDKILLEQKILLPEEVRAAWEGAEYTIERTLQPALWAQRQAEAEEQQQSQEAPPEDTGETPPEGEYYDPNTEEQQQTATDSVERADADNPVLSIIAKADKSLAGLEDDAIEIINSALESAYQDLESSILESYSKETPNLLGRQRSLLLLNQVSGLLGLLNPDNTEEIQSALEQLLQQSDANGTKLAQELTQAISNEKLQMVSQLPLDAIRNQAEEGVKRLRNHTQDFADRASTLVTQGLIQGWGSDELARNLRRELGITQFRAETIARTEALSASNAAAKANYQRNGIEYGQWVATADDRLCRSCSSRNMLVYPLDKIIIPAHPRCRCYVSPWSPTWAELGLIDSDWAAKFRQQGLQEIAALGLEPDDGPSAFEKAAGLPAPEPIWQPRTDAEAESASPDERFDAGKPCGKGWIPANKKCAKGISAQHPAADPNHPKHAEFKAAMGGGGSAPAPAKKAPIKSATPASTTKKSATKKPPAQPPGGDEHFAAVGFALSVVKKQNPKATYTEQKNAIKGWVSDAQVPKKADFAAYAKKAEEAYDKAKAASGDPNHIAQWNPPSSPSKTPAKGKKSKVASGVDVADSAGMYEALKKMGEGAHPDSIKLSPALEQQGVDWMQKQYGYGTNNEPKVEKIGKKAPSVTDNEANALALWLGNGYSKMSSQIWKKEAIPGFQEDPQILAASLMAAKALHKLPKEDAAQIADRIKKKTAIADSEDKIQKSITTQLWNRFVSIDESNLSGFMAKYKPGQEFTEENFKGITHFPPEKMQAFSTGANVIYKVTPKLDGTGQGRYVDDFKNSMQEGEILYPPSTRFRVKAVTQVTPEQAKANQSLIDAGDKAKQAFLTQNDWKYKVTPIATAIDNAEIMHKISPGKPENLIDFKKVQKLTGVKDWAELQSKKSQLIADEAKKAQAEIDAAKAKAQAKVAKAQAKVAKLQAVGAAPDWHPLYSGNGGYVIELEEV